MTGGGIMSTNPTEETSKEVRAILDSVFPQRKKGEEHDEPTPQEIQAAFQRLEAIGQSALDVVARNLRRGLNGPVGKLLAAVGPPALKYVEYTMKTGDVEEQRGAVSVIGNWETDRHYQN
jgi:hypothetical protein